MEKLETIPASDLRKVKSKKKGGHPGGAKRQHESPLCFIDGHVPPCGTYKTFFWDGKTPFERRCGEPSRGTVIPCGAMVEHHSISAETSQGSINLARKFYLEYSLDIALYAERIWKGDILVADIEELENYGRVRNSCSETQMPKRFSCRRVVTISHSRSQMDQSSRLAESRCSENPPQSRITLHKAKSTTAFLAESRTGLNRLTRWRMTVKPATMFGQSQGIVFCRHHVEARVKLCVSKSRIIPNTTSRQKAYTLHKGHFKTKRHLRYINVIQRRHTATGRVAGKAY